jgi:hypothetical protein
LRVRVRVRVPSPAGMGQANAFGPGDLPHRGVMHAADRAGDLRRLRIGLERGDDPRPTRKKTREAVTG